MRLYLVFGLPLPFWGDPARNMDGMGEFRKTRGLTGLALSVLVLTCACSRTIRVPDEGTSQESQTPFQAVGASPGDSQVVGHDVHPQPGDLPFHNAQSVPAGTLLTVRLKDPLIAGNAKDNDSFQAMVDEAVVIEGNTMLPRGASVIGKVESARISKMKPERGSVRLALESVHMGGVDVPVQTASLFARQGPAADISPSTVRLEKGRRLTFRLTEPVLLAPQRTQASR
jgi:hypothetical protein